ncbi:unnamed protein product [Rhodiola kirilowii]
MHLCLSGYMLKLRLLGVGDSSLHRVLLSTHNLLKCGDPGVSIAMECSSSSGNFLYVGIHSASFL